MGFRQFLVGFLEIGEVGNVLECGLEGFVWEGRVVVDQTIFSLL
jgi:hypothetical protein